MANNRMYLRCRTCGEVFMIGKTYQNGYFIGNLSPNNFYNQLNNFYDKHYCCFNKPKDLKYELVLKPKEVNTENQFEIAYETYYKEEK